jgi:nucleoside-diphosphate-sugar epimerase
MTYGVPVKLRGKPVNRMRILVTGNLGYVGSHLTRLLVDSGHEVIGCDLSLFPNSVCGDLAQPTIQWLKDFREIQLRDLVGVDAVAHLAGISNDPMGELNPGLTLRINGEGSVQLARVAESAGVKIFAFASSCSIYGSSGDKPRNEDAQTNPLSEYAASKLFAEKGLTELKTNNFHVYLLRNATAYGASPVLRTDLVVNDLSSGMCATGVAEIRSDGSPWRPLIHCRDMARAFQLFIERSPITLSGKPVNVGFEQENFQVKDIGTRVQASWPEGKLTYLPNSVADPRDYKVDFSLLKTTFPNFAPEHPLSVGIPELKNHLIAIGYSKVERDANRYIRLIELRTRINALL